MNRSESRVKAAEDLINSVFVVQWTVWASLFRGFGACLSYKLPYLLLRERTLSDTFHIQISLSSLGWTVVVSRRMSHPILDHSAHRSIQSADFRLSAANKNLVCDAHMTKYFISHSVTY